MADIESWLFPNTRMTEALREGENNVVVSFCNRKGTTYRNVRNSVTVYGWYGEGINQRLCSAPCSFCSSSQLCDECNECNCGHPSLVTKECVSYRNYYTQVHPLIRCLGRLYSACDILLLYTRTHTRSYKTLVSSRWYSSFGRRSRGSSILSSRIKS